MKIPPVVGCSFGVNDLIYNTFGGSLGFLFFVLARKISIRSLVCCLLNFHPVGKLLPAGWLSCPQQNFIKKFNRKV